MFFIILLLISAIGSFLTLHFLLKQNNKSNKKLTTDHTDYLLLDDDYEDAFLNIDNSVQDEVLRLTNEYKSWERDELINQILILRGTLEKLSKIIGFNLKIAKAPLNNEAYKTILMFTDMSTLRDTYIELLLEYNSNSISILRHKRRASIYTK